MTGIQKDIKELVIFRLEMLPSNVKVSMGMDTDFSKEELIEHVKKEDEIGKKIVDVELEFMRALKEGEFA